MISQVASVLRRHQRAVADGDSGMSYGVGVTGDQRVPREERPSLMEQAVSAGLRQPGKGGNDSGCQDLTVWNMLLAVRVAATAASLSIEQLTADVGVEQLISVLVLDLIEAALSAAIAEGLPLFRTHLVEGLFFPERAGSGSDFDGISKAASSYTEDLLSSRSARPEIRTR